MVEAKTLRIQIFETVRALFGAVLADPTWHFSADKIVSEPQSAPQAEDHVSVRIITYNARGSVTDDVTNPDRKVIDYDSALTVKAHGPRAWAWLDRVLSAVTEETWLAWAAARGWAIQTDDGGIQDTSYIVGAREQLRGEANLGLSCRAVSPTDFVYADTVRLEADVGVDEVVVQVDVDEAVLLDEDGEPVLTEDGVAVLLEA